MIFKCFLCDSIKLWNKKKHFTLKGVDDSGNDIIEKRICQACGDQINFQYDTGKAIADMEIVEDEG